MDKWIELLFNGGGIATGVIAGIVAAFVQFLISHLEHIFIIKTKKAEQTYGFIKWQRDEIGKLIKEVSEIRIPAITETNEDIIENAYHLIIADFERAKPLLYKKNDPVTIKGFFNTLNNRYNQMQDIKLGLEKELKLEDSKRVLIGEIKECKKRLLNVLQDKEKELMSKMI
ncbi:MULTISPECIES: hypothetical protein [Eubacteriales]|uniref:hypothetical protein n=1 Tax=Eubacteriales TaxID=186802 RepID=UPI0011067DAB|nr:MULTISPECIES: hypothetical protein [Eubacteriales]